MATRYELWRGRRMTPVVGPSAGTALGVVEVQLTGGYRALLYEHGRDTHASWAAKLAKETAPWAELASSKLIITLPATNIRKVWVPGDAHRPTLQSDAPRSRPARRELRWPIR